MNIEGVLMNRLELTWYGKAKKQRLEPRLLLKQEELSYRQDGDGTGVFDNQLIYGDNLLALKALEQDYRDQVKCVVIDPPYNTGNAFTHYDDGLEHSIWLSLMKQRLELIKKLMAEDGSLWISIDDDEVHYLKVLCDEIFGRHNFIANVVWEKKYTLANDAKWFSDNHDHLLVYAKNKEMWFPNKLPRTDDMNKAYKNPDGHHKGLWKATPLHAKSGRVIEGGFQYTFKNGVVWSPPAGTFPRFSPDTLKRLDEQDEIWFGKDGQSIPSRKTFLNELKQQGIPSKTVWRFDEVGHNHEAKEEAKRFNPDDVFSTPKPERLIHKILSLATNEGDIVLDSFAGSGTTGAVAHKMKRRWIMVEMGEQCSTHIVPRMKKVIDGEDPYGVTSQTDWKYGGGFGFYKLAPSLLKKDEYGFLRLNPKYTDEMIAQAVCKLKGFEYNGGSQPFWKTGRSTERDYIFVYPSLFNDQIAELIKRELGEDESLLVCCKAYSLSSPLGDQMTIEKIPNSFVDLYEFNDEDKESKD